ncbi:YifB family Mg chelatase-like AAA ATPase [Bacillus sp. T3]|uniref:YifB family Mg chelatase-like AAA ATPase n=1 Tax=Bacillus sp. T3 TaxID=467262 RepID=UPI002982967C|nr:YifB family Mg chelatase-like AAA ATPase [Bacillus sp. T3]
MNSFVSSVGLKGLEGYRIQVEVHAQLGLESITIVGLPDASVRESKRRVAAALYSAGYSINGQKIMINLSPSELRKNGPQFDLPIAIGILKALNLLTIQDLDQIGFIGALSLDGNIQPTVGMLPAILAAKKLDFKVLYIPYDETLPTLHFEKINIIYVSSLIEVIQHLLGAPIETEHTSKIERKHPMPSSSRFFFQQIIGHAYPKYAMEVAAAGEHHMLMTGPPGCGKSMLAESFPSILPPLSRDAQLEMISLYQLAGASIIDHENPPFRNPHHSASGISIIGGGQIPKPGEISLAHRGVLFLDEIAEFTRKTLEMLRQPIECGNVTIARARSTLSFPAAFILIGAMNPCPCGYSGANTHYCVCTNKEVVAYQNKLSGPIRDRFDIYINLKAIDMRKAILQKQENSEQVQKRVIEARERQYHRYGMEMTNSKVPFETLIKDQPLTQGQLQNLQELSLKRNWRNRVQIKFIRLARTIADLDKIDKITDTHLYEAIKLRAASNIDIR